MTAQILYFKGAAAERSYIAAEQSYIDDTVKALEKSGAHVTLVGNAQDGFSWDHFTSALGQHKTADAIIVNAHGNIHDDVHFMLGAHGSKYILAQSFYKAIREAFGSQPANVFMLSCGSGNGLKSALELLPPNSTVFNLVLPERIDSYSVAADAYSIAGNPSSNPAESLFLNMMSKGLPEEWQCNPSLTTTSGQKDAKKINELWSLAANFCCDWSGEEFPEEVIASAQDFMRPHLSEEQMSTALATMRYYSKQIQVQIPAAAARAATPVRAQYVLDTEDFKSEVVINGLLGSIGAMAYAICRDDLGAFQRPVIIHEPNC